MSDGKRSSHTVDPPSSSSINQLLLQAGFVKSDDLSAVLSPADIVVSVLTPSVLELQGHTGIRTEPGWALPCLGESSKVVPEPTALRVTPFLCCLNAAFGLMCFVVGLPVALPSTRTNCRHSRSVAVDIGTSICFF